MSQLTVPSNIIVAPILNGDVSAGAAISASKLQQQRVLTTDFDLDRGDTPVAADKTVFVAPSGGTLVRFGCMLANTGTTTDIDFDLQINGTTVLTAPVNITNTESNDTIVNGTITGSVVNAGDVISVVVTVTTSTGAQGPFVQIFMDEAPVT